VECVRLSTISDGLVEDRGKEEQPIGVAVAAHHLFCVFHKSCSLLPKVQASACQTGHWTFLKHLLNDVARVEAELDIRESSVSRLGNGQSTGGLGVQKLFDAVAPLDNVAAIANQQR